MLERLFQLAVLFFVIFDPFISFTVFISATKNMTTNEKVKTALLAVLVAVIISYSFLIFGMNILSLFNISIEDFRVAAGIILGILGVKMSLGESITKIYEDNNTASAIASIIATPLLTGPAAITTIIISVHDYGMLIPAIAIGSVFIITTLLLILASRVYKLLGKTAIQVISTILGLITISWGVKFIRTGLGL